LSKTLKNIIFVFGAAILSKFIGIFTSLIMPKLLEPANYGVWVTLLLITAYSPIIALGTVETLMKQFPYYAGKGEPNKAKEVEGSVFGSIILSAIALIIIGFSFPFLKIEAFQSASRLIYPMVIAASLNCVSGYFYYRFGARQNFKIFSITDSTRSIITLIILVACTWLWGLEGAVWGFCLIELILFIYLGILSNVLLGKVRANFNFQLIWEMIKIGFPITVIWWVYILQSSAGRVVSMTMLGKTATGYYGLGGSIVSMIVLIPMAIGVVLYPKVSEGLGKNLGKEDMALLIIKPSQALSLMLPVAIGVLILLSPVIYHVVFPKYVNGLLSAQILLFGAFFSCLIRTGANFLIANGEQKRVILYVAISLITVIATSISLVKIELDIAGIALGTALSGLVFTTLIWKAVFKNFGYNLTGQCKQLFNLYAPFLLLLGLLGIFVLISPNLLVNSGYSAMIFTVIFMILYIAIIILSPPFSKTSRDLYHVIKLNVSAKIINPVTY